MTVSTDPRKTGVEAGASLLAASAVAGATHTGSTDETALVTVSIPAIGINGGLRIRWRWAETSSVNNKTLRIRLGGIGGSVVGTITHTTNAAGYMETTVRNRASASSQTCTTVANRSTDFLMQFSTATTTVGTSAAQDLVLSGQLALGTETITLESYEVWLLP